MNDTKLLRIWHCFTGTRLEYAFFRLILLCLFHFDNIWNLVTLYNHQQHFIRFQVSDRTNALSARKLLSTNIIWRSTSDCTLAKNHFNVVNAWNDFHTPVRTANTWIIGTRTANRTEIKFGDHFICILNRIRGSAAYNSLFSCAVYVNRCRHHREHIQKKTINITAQKNNICILNGDLLCYVYFFAKYYKYFYVPI